MHISKRFQECLVVNLDLKTAVAERIESRKSYVYLVEAMQNEYLGYKSQTQCIRLNLSQLCEAAIFPIVAQILAVNRQSLK